MIDTPSVYTLENECHDCYKCIRECPVKAIKIENGHASVMKDRCIACGNCVKTCPCGAKRVRSDVNAVKNFMLLQKDIFVSLAPSWRGVFDCSSKEMTAMLRKLGFSHVSETALGAQEVSIKTAEILNSAENGLFISSACPVIVDYVRLYRPELSKNIIPVASPALTHAKMLKDMYGDKICVVFIGPCIGKKNESDMHPELIDAALTFEELKLWMEDELVEFMPLPEGGDRDFIPYKANEGALYPIDGGMNDTIKYAGVSDKVKFITVSSVLGFEKAVSGLNPENLNGVVFAETLACDGGCISGPCISVERPVIGMVSEIISKTELRDTIPQKPSVVVNLNYDPVSIEKKEHSVEEIAEALKKIGKYLPEDELNCGGCGYNTCRGLAGALIDGIAEPSMCVSYMRKTALMKAAAMLRSMPSAVVIVDSSLNIVESNNAFLKMFAGDMYDIFAARPEGLNGAALDRIVDFTGIFETVFKTGKEIHRERYSLNDRLYDIRAFVIEKTSTVGAIITDVTNTEMNREKIAQRAQEVISKNISIVQEIACLLGEHMVETETLLSTITEGYEK